MNLKKNYKKAVFPNLSKIYRDPLFILTIITMGITIYLLNVQIKIGIHHWDTFIYLNNALYFAGMGNGNEILSLPPFIPILTSLFFRMGYVSVNAIFIVDSIIFIIGIIGLYLLLNQRFNKIQSFTGSLIFLSFPVIMSWVASGGVDIPEISFLIWTIYLTILGVKKNSKYLYLIIPLIMLDFLTKYTAGLILLPILLYLLINMKHIHNIKKVISGILLEIIALIGGFIYFLIQWGAISSFYTTLIYIITSTSTGVGDLAYNPDILYYIRTMPKHISLVPLQGNYQHVLNPSASQPSILSVIIALIVLIGISFYIYKIFNFKIMEKLKINSFNIIKTVLLVILITSFIITFNHISVVISEVIFFGVCYLLYVFLKNPKSKNLDIDVMFFSWFGAYLIFHSFLGAKQDRYFITMAPAFAFFIILGLSEFIDKIKPKIKNKNLKSWGIYSIIALIFLSSATATFICHTPKKCFSTNMEDASSWLKEYDPDYENKIIYADYSDPVGWYLKKEVNKGFPRFFDNSEEFSKFLQKNSAYYYIDCLSDHDPTLNGYHIIKKIGHVVIYRK